MLMESKKKTPKKAFRKEKAKNVHEQITLLIT